MGHITRVNELCQTFARVMSQVWMSHVSHVDETYHAHVDESCHTHVNEPCHTHVDESRHTHEWVMSHTCGWVMSHTWMSHVTHMNESCHSPFLAAGILGQQTWPKTKKSAPPPPIPTLSQKKALNATFRPTWFTERSKNSTKDVKTKRKM